MERIVRKIEQRLESSVPVAVLRRMLGIGEEELMDRLEPVNWEEIKERGKRGWGGSTSLDDI